MSIEARAPLSKASRMICEACWAEKYGSREPYRLVNVHLEWNDCHFCRQLTSSRIYISCDVRERSWVRTVIPMVDGESGFWVAVVDEAQRKAFTILVGYVSGSEGRVCDAALHVPREQNDPTALETACNFIAEPCSLQTHLVWAEVLWLEHGRADFRELSEVFWLELEKEAAAWPNWTRESMELWQRRDALAARRRSN